MSTIRAMPPIVKWLGLCAVAFIALPTPILFPAIALVSIIALGLSVVRALKRRNCATCGGALNRDERARCSDCGAYENGMSSLIARAKTSSPTAMF